MATNYPGALDSYTNPIGTQTLDTPDHAAQHTNVNDAVVAIETAAGTTLGTNLFKNFAAGQFPVRNTGGGATGTLVQTLVGGTYSTPVINNSTLGTPATTGGTLTNPVITTGTSNTSAFNGGTTGTLVNTGGLSLKDNGSIAQTGTVDHVTITPGASKFVRRSIYRQDNIGTNTFLSNQVMMTGWGFIGIASGSLGTKTVTFGSAFANAPVVVTNLIGITLGTAAAIGDFTSTFAGNGQAQAFGANSITTSGFTVTIFLTSNVGAATQIGFSWIAIGSIT